MDEINFWIIVAQMINFGILFFVFKYFLWDKIWKALLERREKFEKLEKIDDDIKEKLTKADEEVEKILEKARIKAWEIEKSAETIAKKNKEKIITEAETQAWSIIDWANKKIEKERLTMINSIKTKVVDLSLKLNEKLFDKEKVNKDFMEKELNSINV